MLIEIVGGFTLILLSISAILNHAPIFSNGPLLDFSAVVGIAVAIVSGILLIKHGLRPTGFP